MVYPLDKNEKLVAVLDYGMGNLYSTQKAIQKIGFKVDIINDATRLVGYDVLILPGVGAFPKAMNNLITGGFITEINNFISAGKKVIGICLGMQLLVDESKEIVSTEGLGLIPGVCERLPSSSPKLPRTNWCDVKWTGIGPTELKRFELSPFYFVHSFFVRARKSSNVLLQSTYHGFEYPVVIRDKNIIGVQFHPEKSGQFGLDLYKFLINI